MSASTAPEAAAPAETHAPDKPFNGVVPPGVDPERYWLAHVYKGDSVPQLTGRAVAVGMALGAFMSLSNLYVSLKTGWSMGVSITAGILAFAIFRTLYALKIVKTDFGQLENNAMQSVASAAGYMTGGGTVAAIPALMMLTGHRMAWLPMFLWIAAIAFLGVVVAIPMKRQMINVEGLRFPTGIAAAETLRSLHAGKEGAGQATSLAVGGVVAAVITWLRDAPKSLWPLPNLPDKYGLPFSLAGVPAVKYSLALDGGLLMVAAGAITGFRVGWSMLLGTVINYGILAPRLYEAGIIHEVSYKKIVEWSLWGGASLMVTASLVNLAYQWRTIGRAFSGLGSMFGRRPAADDPMTAVECPTSWFLWGTAGFGLLVVVLQRALFDIPVWMGTIAVALTFVVAIVACRATGETDITPTNALGKITQLTFGVLDARNVTTNLMTAHVTGGVGLHAADLLTDLKSGYLLGANPRKQFLAQFFGVIAGSLAVVPAYMVLLRSPEDVGSEKWPAPGAMVWAGVAKMLSEGFNSLHPTARWSILVGIVVGVALTVAEKQFPRAKSYIPSPTGVGMAFVTSGANCITMFLGSLIAVLMEKRNKAMAERFVTPVASGIIAGEGVMGIVIALIGVLG